MNKSKKDQFTKEARELADIAKALSHPARVKILQVLAQKNCCICGEIVEVMPLSQSTVSQHLKELKNAGLIDGVVEGPATCYCLNLKKIQKAKDFFSNMFGKICKC